jgi:hypothetical protein
MRVCVVLGPERAVQFGAPSHWIGRRLWPDRIQFPQVTGLFVSIGLAADASSGSGAHTDWNVNIAGQVGTPGSGTISGGVIHQVAITAGANSITSSVAMADATILVGQSGLDPAGVAVGGDLTMINTGVFTIGAQKVGVAKSNSIRGPINSKNVALPGRSVVHPHHHPATLEHKRYSTPQLAVRLAHTLQDPKNGPRCFEVLARGMQVTSFLISGSSAGSIEPRIC